MIKFKFVDHADQKFSTIINNRRVTFRFTFNHYSKFWSFDLALDGDYILHGRRVVVNTNLISEFDFGIGVLFAHSATNVHPGRNELISGLVRFYQAEQSEIDGLLA